eukprot:GDKI01037524.1.p1 GENE.GDKI01037524.1~~GDKI01037524.1.p1  ORF type:complete len:290 (+),score=61.78 GDKI01037524.1:109-978(+)
MRAVCFIAAVFSFVFCTSQPVQAQSGVVAFTARTYTADRKPTAQQVSERTGIRMSKSRIRSDLNVGYDFPSPVNTTLLRSYTIEISTNGTYKELLIGAKGEVWRGGDVRKQLEVFYNDPVIHPYLWAFEAVQRLASPAGMIQQVLETAYNRTSINTLKPYVEEELIAEMGRLVKWRSYTIRIPNDKATRYTPRELGKMFTSWQSVLGESGNESAVYQEHLWRVDQVVKSVYVRVRQQPIVPKGSDAHGALDYDLIDRLFLLDYEVATGRVPRASDVGVIIAFESTKFRN